MLLLLLDYELIMIFGYLAILLPAVPLGRLRVQLVLSMQYYRSNVVLIIDGIFFKKATQGIMVITNLVALPILKQ